MGAPFTAPELRPLPTREQILEHIGGSPAGRLSLKALCAELWPDVPWWAERPSAESASVKLRTWPGGTRMTCAAWLREHLVALVAAGQVAMGPFDPEGAVGVQVGGFTYQLAGGSR